MGVTRVSFEDSQQRGFYSLLALAQALGRERPDEPCRLGVVSSGMQSLAHEPLTCPAKATLLGPSKVIPLEYPALTCRSIDLSLPESHPLDHSATVPTEPLKPDCIDVRDLPIQRCAHSRPYGAEDINAPMQVR